VTTNTTLFEGADAKSVRQFFDEMMDLGVEGMMLSPGYSYDKAPDQTHFLGRGKTRRLFAKILSNRKKTWQFNQSPLFLEFLMGKRQYKCTAWGMPDLQHLRLAEAVLSAAGWVRRQLRRADERHRMAELRHRKRQPPSAPTAWFTAATKPARLITRSR